MFHRGWSRRFLHFPSWTGLWRPRALTLALSDLCLWMETLDEKKSYRGLLWESPELSRAQIRDLKVCVAPSEETGVLSQTCQLSLWMNVAENCPL